MNQGRLRVGCLLLADIMCVAVVWLVVVNLYLLTGFGYYRASHYWQAWPVPLIFVVINSFAHLYHGHWNYPSMPLSQVQEFRRLALSSIMTHVLVMALLGFWRAENELALSNFVSRFVLIASGLLVAATAQVFRDVVRILLARVGLGQIPAFVVGEGCVAEQVTMSFLRNPYYGVRVVKSFGSQELRTVADSGRAMDVKHLFVCGGDLRILATQYAEWARWFTFIEYLPTEIAYPMADARAIQVGGLGGLEMVNQRRMRLLSLEKSVVDRVLALIIFVCAIPFFLIMPILIKLTSKGPVFYKAKRLGKKGRTIYVWKFRSMYADADRRLQSMLDANPALKAEFEKDFKLKNDPRVTPLGKFMRKTSIDELPQLFNVFTHDMAIIGPRPIVEKEVEKYGKAYEIFSSVKPGITGLWQASGRSDCSYEERVALDIHYVLNWSPWMDLWIVFRTAAAVIKMKGSY